VQHVLSAVGAHQLTSFPPLVPFAGTGKNFEVELLSLPYPILLLKKKQNLIRVPWYLLLALPSLWQVGSPSHHPTATGPHLLSRAVVTG
jgi:hypothetical protein